jgi:hypothetical protein
MRNLAIFCLPAILLLTAGAANPPRRENPRDDCPDRDVWVQSELARMDVIQPGMTRAQLLAVFRTEGGLSSRSRRTYVNQNCPYFKVDVEFRTAQEPQGRILGDESPTDVITKISRPYLAYGVAD